MDWIKKNYEKLLLGTFGIFALLVGAGVSISAFLADEGGTQSTASEGRKLGDTQSESAQKALAQLAELSGKPIWTSPKVGEHGKAAAFTGSPEVQKVGVEQPYKIFTSEPLRPPVPNWWLYQHDLDITITSILKDDPDGDKYTNLEEWEGKSNPRDPQSKPAFYAKLVLESIQEEPYTIRFSNAVDDTELQIKRLVPLFQGRPPGRLDYKIGDTLFDDDKRFKITKLEARQHKDATGQTKLVQHVILEDSLNPGKPVAIPVKSELNLPTYRAVVKSSLGNTSSQPTLEGRDIVIADFPGVNMTLKKITPASPGNPASVEIDYTETGGKPGNFKLVAKEKTSP